ncbi:hypothetical protein ACQ4PT_052596 [Festuca glaucescens]
MSRSVAMEATTVPELSGHPDIPAADSENRPDIHSDIPVSTTHSDAMDSTFVPVASAPANTPGAAHGSDVIDDNVLAQASLSDDITRHAQVLVEVRNVSDAADLVEALVLRANKIGNGKKKLQPLHVKDKEIRSIVAEELGITTEMLRSSMSIRLDQADNARKATPKRKVIRKVKFADVQATRASPRLAKQRASSCVRNVEATPTPVIDLDSVSPGMPHCNPACINVHPQVKPSSSDAVITSATKVVDNVGPRVRFGAEGNVLVSATTLFDNIVQHACINVHPQAEPSKDVDNVHAVEPVVNVLVKGGPGGFVPTMSPLLNMDPPIWNFSSQSPVRCDGPSVDNEAAALGPNVPIQCTSASTDRPLYATLIAEHGTDDIPEGTPITAPMGNKCKLPSKGKSEVISLDDLLVEKIGVQGVQSYKKSKTHCNNSNAVVQEIEPMWVTTSELADSMRPDGQLSNMVCDIGVAVLQDSCPDNMVIFPFIVTKYLMDHKFNSNVLRKHFRKDESYKLSHKDLLSFPVLHNIGTVKDPIGHWYVLSLNFDAKSLNCGIFMLKFLELWNGSVVPPITGDQIPAVRKVLTASWLEHPGNNLCNWRSLLDNNMF